MGAYLPTMTSCVSAPGSDIPTDPPSDVSDTAWPDQWSADITAWTYPGWESTATESKGRFYYDKQYGSKLAYTYLRGKPSSTVEAWNANVDGKDKMYFTLSKTFCLGFDITDPGIKGSLFHAADNKVGLEHPDWMKRCHDAGFAHLVSRELVTVDGKEEWADHYSCKILYDKVNQSIVFQNWHSLGLGAVPKGLPLRVTGGNSQPDPQQSPRMNSVWHSNFSVGPSSSTKDDFLWNPLCLGPLCTRCHSTSAEEAEEFFGHPVQKQHLSSVDFVSRGRFLPLAKANARDLTRAAQRKPGRSFQGRTFQETMQKLNKLLTLEADLKTKACDQFSMSELHDFQQL